MCPFSYLLDCFCLKNEVFLQLVIHGCIFQVTRPMFEPPWALKPPRFLKPKVLTFIVNKINM